MRQSPGDGTLCLRVSMAHGELPQWLGDALASLAREPHWRVQIVHEMAASSPPEPPGLPDAMWRQRLSGLQPWNDRRAGKRPRLARSDAEGAADVTLVLDSTLAMLTAPRREAPASPYRPVWFLGDRDARALSPHFPLLSDICSGRGVQLRLLARDPRSAQWHRLRSLHRNCSASYHQGLISLAAATRDLLSQAMKQHLALLTAAAAQPAARRPRRVWQPRPAALLPCGGAILQGWLGAWRTWMARQRSLWVSEYWRIGVIDAPIASLLGPDPVPSPRWITPATRSRYWADPFGVPGNPQRLICELFDERTGVGHLEMLEVDENQSVVTRTRLPIGGGRHVSFPNVFEMDGRRLALAESVASRECVLHEVDDKGVWRRVHVLLDGVAAADPALFKWQDRYWLAFTDADRGEMDNLCLYHADRLDGQWRPHARNPVKIDIRSARMAGGVFRHGDALYRPGQDCLRTYGAAVVLHRIVRLTPDEFDEVAVRRLSPDRRGACPDGLHTVSAWGERTLVDGKRHGFNSLVVWRKLRRRSPFGVRRFASSVLPAAHVDRRLLVYLPNLKLGGGEISMLKLAEGLAQTGMQVDLVVHQLAGSELPVPPGVQVTSLACGGTLAGLWGLVRHIRATRPHWVLTAFPHTNIAAVLALALARTDARCVVTEHAPLSQQIAQQSQWRFRVLPSLVRWAYRRAHAVIAVSAGVRADLQEMVGIGIAPEVINNPVLPGNLEAELAMAPEHPWLLDDRLHVVMSVSRLSPEKELAVLIRAFARLHAIMPSARLLLVGDGPESGALQALVNQLGLQSVAQLPGRTAHPLRWMARASVFAMSSRYEGFGNALVEALACGTPVVSTDCPVGPREVLAGGRWGELVPVGDEAALSAAIHRALLRGRVQPAGAREAARRFTQAAACRAYQGLLEALYRTDKRAC